MDQMLDLEGNDNFALPHALSTNLLAKIFQMLPSRNQAISSSTNTLNPYF